LKPELVIHSYASSPAAARTSGLTALILQRSPDITPGSVKDLLIRSAEDRDGSGVQINYPADIPTWDEAWGFGLVDGYQAVIQLERKDADITFIGFDGSAHPNQPWYYSAAIETDSQRNGKNPTEGVQDKIYTQIINKGPNVAKNVRVNFAFYPFTIGVTDYNDKFYDIGSVIIPELNPNAAPKIVSIDWTPPKRIVQENHGCIRVTIDYGYDAAYGDMSNVAQKNVWIEQVNSPAFFTFRVENPLPNEALIQLNVTSDYPTWNVSLSETAFIMKQGDCARVVTAKVDPPHDVTPGSSAIFFIGGTATPFIEPVIKIKPPQVPTQDIGGVALVANVPKTVIPVTTIPLKTIATLMAVIFSLFLFRRET